MSPRIVDAVPSSDGRLLRIQCPLCGLVHAHGAGGGEGHRAAECGSGGYILRINPSAPVPRNPSRARVSAAFAALNR